MNDTKEKWEEEFRDRFGIIVTPDHEKDGTKAFLMEKYWQEGALTDIVVYFKEVISQQRDEARREVLKELHSWLVYKEGYAVDNHWTEEEFAILDDVAKYVYSLLTPSNNKEE